MGWVNKSKWATVGAKRYNGFSQVGSNGNGVSATAYSAVRGKLTGQPTTRMECDVPNQWPVYQVGSGSTVAFQTSVNSSWSALVDNIRGESANLGATLGEGRESLEMIARRFGTCYRAYRGLRKGDFRGFLKELNIGPKRKHRNLIRNEVNRASSLWLEYSFGWKPLFGDVYKGLNAMGQPIPGGVCTGRGSQSFIVHEGNFPPGLYNANRDYRGRFRYEQGCHVVIDNPNLYLLQQMGLANPLSVAWELVPFSFVVDWVLDVGTCLGGLTDLLGCSVTNPWSTASCKYLAKLQANEGTLYNCSGPVFSMRRKTTLTAPVPSFNIRANLGSSLNRAANAASLLGQMLTS